VRNESGYIHLREVEEPELGELLEQVEAVRDDERRLILLLLSWLICTDSGRRLFSNPEQVVADLNIGDSIPDRLTQGVLRVLQVSAERVGTAPAWLASMASRAS
jgi:hypothetical protein